MLHWTFLTVPSLGSSLPPLLWSVVIVLILFFPVFYSGLNFIDLMVRQGNIDNPPKTPLVPGFECSGIVEALGDSVKGFEVISFLFSKWEFHINNHQFLILSALPVTAALTTLLRFKRSIFPYGFPSVGMTTWISFQIHHCHLQILPEKSLVPCAHPDG